MILRNVWPTDLQVVLVPWVIKPPAIRPIAAPKGAPAAKAEKATVRNLSPISNVRPSIPSKEGAIAADAKPWSALKVASWMKLWESEQASEQVPKSINPIWRKSLWPYWDGTSNPKLSHSLKFDSSFHLANAQREWNGLQDQIACLLRVRCFRNLMSNHRQAIGDRKNWYLNKANNKMK